MIIYVYADAENNVRGWASTRGMEAEVEVEIAEDHAFFKDNPFKYQLINGVLVKSEAVILQRAKDAKDKELNKACNEAILAGFSHVINGITYWFSYDYEAQGNFRDAREVLKDGLLTEVPWTVREGGIDGAYTRIPVNLALMNELTIKCMEHKTTHISKYRDFLMPLVTGAETPEEVAEVKW